eukprot:CAMPEP_0179019522 /NCGR_PEP_ID=MMETSP0796-20121207/4909_1 /TAXON_ID=73915 /ORGANISM="Pyrodinium bahamense, Strain pbaha01" /LENGTH=1078 /DNA_ID=CAMNT_0020715307 /DNA_START=14 /DNA_END=3250 /DNA_ORIENTATION=-
MARGMDEAGLLNSMTVEQLTVTCNRLQRSCNDMEMLLSEFEQEQVMLRREQDRLQQRIEKVTAQIQIQSNKKDRGIIWNLINDVDTRLEVSHIFKAKEERKAAKRRSLSRPAEYAPAHTEEAHDEEDTGPFSDANLQMSWGCDLSLGVLRQHPSKGPDIIDLEEWIRVSVCGDSVAEAEPLPENAEMWARQFAATAAAVQHSCPSPNSSPNFSNTESTGFMNGESAAAARMWSPRCDNSPPQRSPPASARRIDATVPAMPFRGASTLTLEAFSEGEGTAAPSGGEDGQSVEALVGSALGMDRKATGRRNDAPAPPSFSRRMTEAAGGAIQWVAELAAGAGGSVAEPCASRGEASASGEAASTVTSLTVVLQRKNEKQLWGLVWLKDGFERKGERIVEKTVKNSVAESWNKQQEQAGHPERCIRPCDRLVSVNGKTGREEIKGELASQEVVLEFHRVVPCRDSAAPPPKATTLATAETLGGARPEADGSPRKDSKRATFQDAFSAYLEAVVPIEKTCGDEAEDFLANDANVSMMVDNGFVFSPDARDNADGKQSTELENSEAEPVQDAMKVKEEVVAPSDSIVSDPKEEAAESNAPCKQVNKAPYGVVVQVLSLGGGSVRLSWLFDWDAAPAGLAEETWVAKHFEVVHQSKASADVEQEQERVFCPRPQLTLQLPVGRRYTFEVRAVLVDTRIPGDAEEADDTGQTQPSTVWASPASQPVAADLRGPVRCVSAEQPTVAAGALETSPPRPNRTRVAAGLGSFLEQGSRIGAVVDHRAVSSTPAAVAAPDSPPKRANASDASSGSTAPASCTALSVPEKPAAVVMGPVMPVVDPLNTAKPLVVAAKPLDPAAEKRDIAERLRIRRGGTRVALQETQGLERQCSMDSDDEGSLMRLSHALSSLERTAASKLKDYAGDAVAQEGYHSLQRRLESGPEEPVHPASSVRHSGDASSPTMGQRPELPLLVARPAPDSADDANFGESDAGARQQGVSAAPPAPAQPTPPEGFPRQASVFRLSVQVSEDRVCQIEFGATDDLPQLVKDFIAQNHMRELFEGPLLKHAQLMRQSGREHDSVDIVDLLD